MATTYHCKQRQIRRSIANELFAGHLWALDYLCTSIPVPRQSIRRTHMYRLGVVADVRVNRCLFFILHYLVKRHRCGLQDIQTFSHVAL